MKKNLLFLLTWLSFQSLAQHVWVSDEIEAPLRKSPELNAKIVAMLPAGQQVVALDQNKEYVKIKTADGQQGWLANYYVLRQQSVHARLAPTEKALEKAQSELKSITRQLTEKKDKIKQLESEMNSAKSVASKQAQRAKTSESGVAKLNSDNERLQNELATQSEKMAELAKALDIAKQQATDARARYLSLVKVSENVVEIDKQNRGLQKKAVQFEQQVQQLRAENQSLKGKIGKKEFLIGVLTVLGGILVGYVLSVMMPPRGRRPRGYSSL